MTTVSRQPVSLRESSAPSCLVCGKQTARAVNLGTGSVPLHSWCTGTATNALRKAYGFPPTREYDREENRL